MSSLNVEYWETSRLVPYAKNARLHDEAQVRQIAASMARFGFVNPILVDAKGEIVAGHGRALAAQLNGAPTVPVIVLGHLTEDEVKAYRIADNRLAEIGGGWNMELVRSDLSELLAGGFDIELTGFAIDDLRQRSEADPEVVPPTPAKPISVAGDLWQLGRHRLVCGDSTDAETVARVLAGTLPGPNLMVTDPPYGVEYDPNWRNEAARTSAGMGNRAIGAGAVGKVLNDDRADWKAAWDLFPGDVAYVWHGALHAGEVAGGLVAAGFVVRSQIIWDKTRMIIGRGDYHWEHEPCWYLVRKGKTGHWVGGRKQTTVWRIGHQKSETGHGTQKPVECMKRPIENNSKKGEAVYEPFSGSGTTIIAAEMTGRRCLAVELNPAYVDVAVTRWQEFAGAEARLDGDGRTFAEVAAARSKKAARSSRAARSQKAKASA